MAQPAWHRIRQNSTERKKIEAFMANLMKRFSNYTSAAFYTPRGDHLRRGIAAARGGAVGPTRAGLPFGNCWADCAGRSAWSLEMRTLPTAMPEAISGLMGCPVKFA